MVILCAVRLFKCTLELSKIYSFIIRCINYQSLTCVSLLMLPRRALLLLQLIVNVITHTQDCNKHTHAHTNHTPACVLFKALCCVCQPWMSVFPLYEYSWPYEQQLKARRSSEVLRVALPLPALSNSKPTHIRRHMKTHHSIHSSIHTHTHAHTQYVHIE